MDELQPRIQSEIADIFNDYRTKLHNIEKRPDESETPAVEAIPDNTIERNFKRLVEIITQEDPESEPEPENELEQEPPVVQEDPEVFDELDRKLHEARTIVNNSEYELQRKYSMFEKVVADALKKLENGSRALQSSSISDPA